MHGIVFNIQDYCIHDGPGIRTTVFFKGCPLHCQWCSNPESMSVKPELGIIRVRCNRCDKCIPVCPEGALSGAAGEKLQIDRERCTTCGNCVEACLPGALAVYGKEMTIDELVEQVRKDEIFYRGSGGGVTLSGGEPLQQPDVACALLERCREAGIHTAIETTGHTSPAVFSRVLALTDYVLFDLKHMDSAEHQRYTGQPNELILANARRAVASGVPVLFRMPMIPGVNDTDWNIQATAAFIKSLGQNPPQLELLPFHRMGMGKYDGVGKTYQMGALMPPELSRVETVRQAFEALGIVCTISR